MVEGWTEENKNESNEENDGLYESIEEEINCSANESPLINAKTKAKGAGLMPPLPPRQQSHQKEESKLKVETMTNFNNQRHNDRDDLVACEDPIEEDIHPDTADTDGDLY